MKSALITFAMLWLCLGGCYSAPQAREIEDQTVNVLSESNPASAGNSPDHGVSRAGKQDPRDSDPEPTGNADAETDQDPEKQNSDSSAPRGPAVSGHYRSLRYKGVIGGSFQFELAGSPSQVADLLMNFSGTAAHRAWAKKFSLRSQDEKATIVTWQFEGKAGINPVVDLQFQRREDKKGLVIRYKIIKEAFGLAAFFGDYRFEAMPGTPARTKLTERVFIDSGLWIANASAEEVEAGLREDARLLVAWAAALRQPQNPQWVTPKTEANSDPRP